MTQAAQNPPGSLPRSVALFAITEGVLIFLLFLALGRFLYSDPVTHQTLRYSAWVAFVVQIFTFALCKLVARQNVMAGWGMGALLRLATLLVWGYLGVKALGLVPMPAMVSLAAFFFVSTLVEPLFLNN
ncbi:MAG: hypothetical protein ACO1Q7_07945 [Gemmatimonas sp.]